ncbi:hypothetical protein TrRE_jg91, partial [Triparma retinervis]
NLTVGGGYTIQVTASEASEHSSRQRSRLRSLRKLSLILDLDHTLVHCVAHDAASTYCNDPLLKGTVRNFLLPMEYANLEKGVGKGESLFFKLFGFNDPHLCKRHYLKLRPGFRDFISAVSDKYELSIYTAGTRYYALKVAHALCRYLVGAPDVDVFTPGSLTPLERSAISLNKKLFGNRIISRSDTGDLGKDVKSLKRAFPDGGQMSVMVDDREDVWANAQDNVSRAR